MVRTRSDPTDSVPRVRVPVFFFLGCFDRHVDARIATHYLESLDAPVKRVFWFESSAHNIPFEEPERFVATVAQLAESLDTQRHAIGPADRARTRRRVRTMEHRLRGVIRSRAPSTTAAPSTIKL
jgi:hypothetical protein